MGHFYQPPLPSQGSTSGTPPTPHDPIGNQGTSVPPRRAASAMVAMLVVLASWPTDLEPRLERPNDTQKTKIAPLTLKYGSQPTPSAFLSTVELNLIVGQWQPDAGLPQLPRAKIAPILVPIIPTIPVGPLTVPEIAAIVASWPPDAPLSRPNDQPQKIVTLALPTGVQPTPSSFLSATELTQIAATWAVTWDAQARPRSVVPSLPTGAQPIPQAPLSVVELVQFNAAWQQSWDAQTYAKNAAWNVPPVPPAVRALPLAAHVYAASQPPDPPPVQRLQSIVPTFPTVSQPTPQGQSTYLQELPLLVAAWTQTWDTQRLPSVVAMLPIVQPLVGPPPPAIVLASMNLVWQQTWDTQRRPSLVATFPVVSQPPVRGPQSIAITLAHANAVWQISWDTQRLPSLVATLPVVDQPPVRGPQPIAVALTAANATWQQSWDTQRLPSVTAALPVIPPPPPQSPLSVVKITQAVAAATVTWGTQTVPPNAAWNIPSIPLAVRQIRLPAHLYAAWEPPDPLPVQRVRSAVPWLQVPPNPRILALCYTSVTARSVMLTSVTARPTLLSWE